MSISYGMKFLLKDRWTKIDPRFQWPEIGHWNDHTYVYCFPPYERNLYAQFSQCVELDVRYLLEYSSHPDLEVYIVEIEGAFWPMPFQDLGLKVVKARTMRLVERVPVVKHGDFWWNRKTGENHYTIECPNWEQYYDLSQQV